MSLLAIITRISKTYFDATRLLSMYVRDINGAIENIQKRNAVLTHRLVCFREGRPNDVPLLKEGEKTVTIELEIDALDEFIELTKLPQSYPSLASRMAYVNLIATFDAFLTDIFEAVILSRPEILKSKKQLTYEKILDFTSRTDLILYLAKRELNELSYKSAKDQADYYKERFGIVLTDSGVSMDELVELRTTRNVLVHNNGIVNHIFLDQLPTTTYKLGDSVIIDLAYFDSAASSLNKIADFLVIQLSSKYAEN